MAAPKPGGFKMSLGGLKAKPGLKASLAQKDVKRLRLALDDDEPDDSNKKQEILGWDAAEGGALEVGGKKEKEGPRIIPVPPNRDWRAEALRKKLVKAPHQQAQNRVDMAKIEEQRMDYGLTYIKKDEPRENGGAEIPASEPMEDVKDNLTNEQRLEKKALDTLLSGKSVDEDHIIPVLTEEDAFLQGLHNAPDEPTLEAYEATPIEGFGAALLRGMGWKDGEAIGKNGILPKAKETKRRPALLGIGAKAEAAVGIELGEWGPKKGKGKKVAESYNPVTLRNKRTGEMLTEEELKAKLESQEMVQEERPEKGKRKYDDEEEEEKRRKKMTAGGRSGEKEGTTRTVIATGGATMPTTVSAGKIEIEKTIADEIKITITTPTDEKTNEENAIGTTTTIASAGETSGETATGETVATTAAPTTKGRSDEIVTGVIEVGVEILRTVGSAGEIEIMGTRTIERTGKGGRWSTTSSV